MHRFRSGKTKGLYAIGVVMICTASLLFGCGNTGTDPSSAAQQTKEQKEPQAEAQTDAAASDDSGQTGRSENTALSDEKNDGEKLADANFSEAGDDAESESGSQTENPDAGTKSGSEDGAAAESAEDKEEEEKPEEVDEQTKIGNQYRDILLQYKQIQDARLSQEEVEESGLTTELLQHGWPFACSVDEVKYLFYDIDDNGISELFITYYDDIVDIYAYDGEKVRYIFGCPYRGISELYPGGMLSLAFSYSADRWYTKWYEYDTGFGDFFPSFEAVCDDGRNTVYFEFGSIDDGREEIEKTYKQMGEYPVWVYEWVCEDTKEEYENLCPKEPAVRLPEGKKLADVSAESIIME